MPYQKRPAFKDPGSVVAQGISKQVARSAFLISGLAPAVALTVIHPRLGIHFENVCFPLRRDQSPHVYPGMMCVSVWQRDRVWQNFLLPPPVRSLLWSVALRQHSTILIPRPTGMLDFRVFCLINHVLTDSGIPGQCKLAALWNASCFCLGYLFHEGESPKFVQTMTLLTG